MLYKVNQKNENPYNNFITTVNSILGIFLYFFSFPWGATIIEFIYYTIRVNL